MKDVTVTDDQNFTINLNKANPRFFYFYFIENSEIQVAILPKHIWENEDWTTFQNYDPAKGLPVGTGPFKLAEAGPQGVFFDRDDNWWGAKAGVFASAAYTRIRKQFNQPVGKFEGVEAALTRMAGAAYIIDAARSVTTGARRCGMPS